MRFLILFLILSKLSFAQIDNALKGNKNLNPTQIQSQKENSIQRQIPVVTPPQLQNSNSNAEISDFKEYIDKNKEEFNHDYSSIKAGKKRGISEILISMSDQKDSKLGITNTFILKAFNALNDKNYEIAIYYYKKALAMDSKNKDALFGLGVCYQFLNQYDQAINVYKKIIIDKKSDEQTFHNLLLSLANKDDKNALDILLDINKKEENVAVILGQIGLINMRLKNYENAISYLSKTIELTIENAIYAYNLALCYDKLQKPDYAKYYYDFALQNGLSSQARDIDIGQIRIRIKELNKELLKIAREMKGKEKLDENI